MNRKSKRMNEYFPVVVTSRSPWQWSETGPRSRQTSTLRNYRNQGVTWSAWMSNWRKDGIPSILCKMDGDSIELPLSGLWCCASGNRHLDNEWQIICGRASAEQTVHEHYLCSCDNLLFHHSYFWIRMLRCIQGSQVSSVDSLPYHSPSVCLPPPCRGPHLCLQGASWHQHQGRNDCWHQKV